MIKIRVFRVVTAALLSVTGLLAACMPKLPAPTPPQKVNVETWSVATADIHESIELPGLLRAFRTITISAEVSGIVKEVSADVGSNVAPGSPLIRLDDTDLVLMKKQAEAQVEAFTQQIAEVKRGARVQQVNEARSGVAAAKASFDLAESTFKRREELAKEKLMPAEAVDAAAMQLALAQAGLDRAKQVLELVQEGATPETIKALEAQLEAAKAAVALTANRLSKVLVSSPIKGVVTRRHLDEDEFAAPGMPLFDIILETPLVISLGVPERIFSAIRKDDPVKVRMGVLKIQTDARVTKIAPAADPMSQTFRVEVNIDNPLTAYRPLEGADPGPGGSPIVLRPGLIAEVEFGLGVRKDAVSIPAETLLMEEEILYVYVLADGKPKIRPVMIGIKKDGLIEIVSGLSKGDLLVVAGQKMLREGDEVSVVKEHKGPRPPGF